MKVLSTQIPEVLIIEPTIHTDARGFFFESFNKEEFAEATGLNVSFVQDNHSRSLKNVLRGLHYQIQKPQGKLLRVIAGEIFDVAVDVRKSSRNFGKWIGVMLSEENKKVLWVPPGFAHGFLTMSARAEVLYKTTEYYTPEFEIAIAWNDGALGIEWPLSPSTAPILSHKDQQAKPLDLNNLPQ